MEKKFTITKRELILGIIIGILGFSFNFVLVYFSKTVDINCNNGTIEHYYKSNLSQEAKICGLDNPYIYNDNNGLGVMFPNKATKIKLFATFDNHPTNITFNYINK